MRRVVLVEQPADELWEEESWSHTLDSEGRLVIAAVPIADEWTVYLAFDDMPLDYDVQAIVGSLALN